MSAPDLTKKVIGFRAFRIADGELAAMGISEQIRWIKGVNRARCYAQQGNSMFGATHPPNEPGIVPNNGCHCGLYGLHQPDPKWAIGELVQNKNIIAGAIAAHGKLEVHATGFRAEYAQIVLLGYDPYVGIKAGERFQEIAQLYGVRLVDINDLAREAKEFGDTIPANLLPKTADDAEALKSSLGLSLPPSAYSYFNLPENERSRWLPPPPIPMRQNKIPSKFLTGYLKEIEKPEPKGEKS